MNRLFPTVILAGGLATRLRPQTDTIPKSMVPVCGKPFIAHQLKLLAKNGIQNVILCTGFLGEQIEEYVGTGASYGLTVSYSSDWPNLLGTAGSIKKALPLIPSNDFFVIYGDSYLPCCFEEIESTFKQSKLPSLMTVYANHNLWDKSNVVFENGKLLRYDKHARTPEMNHIDYGLGIFNKSTLENLSLGEPFDLAELYKKLLANNQVVAHEVKERFYEIGSLAGQKALTEYLRQQEKS